MNTMDYLQSLLGVVSTYGLRADHAARDIINRTVDEFALAVSQATGMSFEYLTTMKKDITQRVMSGQIHQPGFCKGRTKFGVPCKKRALMGYCDVHREQEDILGSKKRRVDAHVARSAKKRATYGRDIPSPKVVTPGKYRFM